MRNYKLLSLKDSQEWNNLLERLPLNMQDVYYKSNYYELFEKLDNSEAKCFVFEASDNLAIYPFLVRSVNDLGFDLDQKYFDIEGAYAYNGVVSNSFDNNFIDQFYETFYKFCLDENIIAEFTRFNPLLDNHIFSESHLDVLLDRDTVSLNLTNSYDYIWTNEYSSKNRNVIRKARKKGHTSQIIHNPDDKQLERFIDIYRYSMKKAEADDFYFFDKSFFYNSFDILANNSLLINILNEESEVICSSIFLYSNNYFHYHLSGRNEFADNTVNNFLLDEAVQYAINQKKNYFHLGGGRTNDPKDSLLKFKSSFSKSKRLSFYIGKKVHNEKVYKDVVSIWEKKNPQKNKMLNNVLLKYHY